MDEVHVCCHPPHGFYTNVSILGPVPMSVMWMSWTVFLNLGKSKAMLSD